ncbi:transcriptional regulator [Lujinxingia litoralis]|uniref:HTH-type transcriptional regulator n=1 Tax=Lujinxingia litoralis TaxID=2211119 RepID=A0A328C7H8_9DELT|nr:transcriptional regulator [Lujinxingia litoralis]RAL22374.1 transcriptional regulator [Lujinxingia litoralis]
MKGYNYRTSDNPPTTSLPLWEALVTDAVGDVIEFWGFKRNHGRVWALLYLRRVPMNSSEIQDALELSKGAVSMITRDLELWNVVRRVRQASSSAWHFVAEVEFMQMITQVLEQREGQLISRVATDLKDAGRLAAEHPDVDDETLERIERMRRLAAMIQQALAIFAKTARLDVSNTRDLL